MKTDAVAKLPGLFQRGAVWWLRVMIPLDLRPTYGGSVQLVRSLKTSDWREAGRLGALRRAELLQEFEDKRRALNPQPVAQITPELGATLAAGIRAGLLQRDDAVRSSPGSAEIWLRFTDWAKGQALAPLRIGPPPALSLPTKSELDQLTAGSPLSGLTPSQFAKLAAIGLADDSEAAGLLATRHLAAVVPLADGEARRLGLLIDWHSPEARPVLLDCLRAYRAAMTDIVSRNDGQDIPTALRPEKVADVAPVRLRDVYGRWKEAKRRSEDAVRACERALAAFEEQSGNPPITKITRAQGSDFRAWLLKQKLSSKTAHDRLTWVKSLLRFAYRDLELIPRQPWEGIDIEHRTESPRRPWTDKELQAFFGLPLFRTYELPAAIDAAGDAAYWIPLLGLYTGARVGELCQLRVVDVTHDEGGPLLRITEEAEGATLKTEASRRDVPVHSELVRLGFLAYVESQRKAGSVSLWPRMRFRKGKPSANFSEWFRTARDMVQGGVPDFHSLRHTVRTALTEAAVLESIKDRVTGHGVKGSTGTRVYEHPKAEIRRAVEQIKYSALGLPKVYAR